MRLPWSRFSFLQSLGRVSDSHGVLRVVLVDPSGVEALCPKPTHPPVDPSGVVYFSHNRCDSHGVVFRFCSPWVGCRTPMESSGVFWSTPAGSKHYIQSLHIRLSTPAGSYIAPTIDATPKESFFVSAVLGQGFGLRWSP